jgi:hypothetical protein
VTKSPTRGRDPEGDPGGMVIMSPSSLCRIAVSGKRHGIFKQNFTGISLKRVVLTLRRVHL